jgi:hypothetical protein
MHGHGLPPGFINTLVLVQYLIFLPDPALAIRQQYLSGVLPRFSAQDPALYAAPNLVEDFANKIEVLRLRIGSVGQRHVEEILCWDTIGLLG